MSTKSDLMYKILYRLGYPMVKVELNDDIINSQIEHARNRFIRFAVGNATQEVFFTICLSAGVTLYDLPGGVVDIVGYSANAATTGGINTLFTIQHMLYEQGMFGLLNPSGGMSGGYNMISYHIARMFLKTLEKYITDQYNFKYQRSTNQLEIWPAPTDQYLTENMYASPGYILVRSFMIDGSSMAGYAWEGITDDSDLYNSEWVENYATAKCKQVLGLIRRKFANFSAVGNTGMAMDGDALVQEGLAEEDKLNELLRKEEEYEGYPIMVG